jgi:hypothetical protein
VLLVAPVLLEPLPLLPIDPLAEAADPTPGGS